MRAFGFGPSLALRQGGRGAAFEFAGGSLPAGATLTRASAGSCFDASGALVSLSADVPRFDYDPDSHRLRGLLIEPARSNLVLRSRALDTAPWTTSGSGSVVAAASGFTLTDSDTANSYTISQNASVTTGDAVSVSLRVAKDGVGKAVRALLVRLANPKLLLLLDTATGELALGTGSLGVPTAMSAESCGGFWLLRASYVATGSTASMILSAVYGQGAVLADIAANGSLTGSVTLADPQIEIGVAPTSTITSAASAGSRAADVLTLAWGSKGVSDGTRTIRYGFDDGSQQDVATAVAGGTAVVPVSLSRSRLLRAQAV